MNICIVVGARPNFIKVAPILRAADKARAAGDDISCRLVYAGRDDDATLEPQLFDDLQMRKPDVFLGVDCENLNELTGQVMSAFERYLQQNKTDVVIVVDDLASTMAAAIVTKKQGLTLAHLVAGTRSFDINMPKEINRLVIDGLSDLLFTAGLSSNRNGTAAYYLADVGEQDTKKVTTYMEGKPFGAFILAAVEYEKLYYEQEAKNYKPTDNNASVSSCKCLTVVMK